jgi:hypothetical protein
LSNTLTDKRVPTELPKSTIVAVPPTSPVVVGGNPTTGNPTTATPSLIVPNK